MTLHEDIPLDTGPSIEAEAVTTEAAVVETADPQTIRERLENLDYKDYLAAAAVVGAGLLAVRQIAGHHKHARNPEGRKLTIGNGDRHDDGLLATVVEHAGDLLAVALPASKEAAEKLAKDTNYKRLFAMTKDGIVYPTKGNREDERQYIDKIKKVAGWVMYLLPSSDKKSRS